MLGVACGPSVGTGDGEGGSGDDTGADSSGSATSVSATSVADTGGTMPMPTTDPTISTSPDPTSDVDSGDVEECVDGTFVGLYLSGAEASEFESCQSGERWWFEEGGLYGIQCADLWITVEGRLCGPGQYGHLGGYEYELQGTIVEGPCRSDCVGEPDPATCGDVEDLCPTVECDVALQDCASYERCKPVAYPPGTPPWTGSRCIDMGDLAPQIGWVCKQLGGPWSDTCGQGFCAADSNGETRCVPTCNPEAPDCDDGTTCWPCDVDTSSGLGPFGVCTVDETAC